MKEHEFDSRISTYILRLEKLDAGERARLKRCVGQTLAEARHGTLGLFYSVLPFDVPAFQHDIYFLVASLYPMTEGNKSGDLGASLHQMRNSKNTRGVDRRMEILLDADEAQLPYRLRQAIHMLQANRVGVNWPQLLEDLLYWTHPSRLVQRRWAQSYFAI
ncbi:MAG: type I-E CRISPR-associated protein Cse2/CasB [Anaerolineaceae bacterium]|jgi:CRISPR system Cascade subunit CasB